MAHIIFLNSYIFEMKIQHDGKHVVNIMCIKCFEKQE
jgi:hypothetical protein